MKAKIIVLEGLDGCGKKTQSELLYRALEERGFSSHMLSFPNYDSYSSEPVKQLLSGKVKADPYQASSIYAMDRYITLREGDFLKKFDVVVMDRYTTSNMLYQTAMAPSEEDAKKVLRWIEDLEYGIMSIPKPDLTFFLSLPAEKSIELLRRRNQERGETVKGDIYEKEEILRKVSKGSKILIKECGWKEISCLDRSNEILPVKEIHEKILDLTLKVL